MPLDGFRGEEPRGPWCASCNAPIGNGQRHVRVKFVHDPYGFRGLTGTYHEACSKPFAAMARVIDMLSFRRI